MRNSCNHIQSVNPLTYRLLCLFIRPGPPDIASLRAFANHSSVCNCVDGLRSHFEDLGQVFDDQVLAQLQRAAVGSEWLNARPLACGLIHTSKLRRSSR